MNDTFWIGIGRTITIAENRRETGTPSLLYSEHEVKDHQGRFQYCLDEYDTTDLPTNALHIRGWAFAPLSAYEPVTISIGLFDEGAYYLFPASGEARPDVAAAFELRSFFPDCGFAADLDLTLVPGGSYDVRIVIQTHETVDLNDGRIGGGEPPVPFSLVPDPKNHAGRRSEPVEMRSREDEKRRWILRNLQCPGCGAENLTITAAFVACLACGTNYAYGSKSAPIMITPAIRDRFNIHDTDNVSALGYDSDILAIVEEVRAAGGIVLDAGAGAKSKTFPHVVNLEIVDYQSTDVLGVGQALPFRDGCFDAVLSIAVLEHVDDPFKCASELIRVLKPGGRLWVAAPFLQPEHGYPEHYFNMTRSGLHRLFKDKGEIVRQFIPAGSHPLFALHWFLQLYANNLPREQRRQFTDITIAEFLDCPPEQWVRKPVGEALPEHARWVLACGTALELKK